MRTIIALIITATALVAQDVHQRLADADAQLAVLEEQIADQEAYIQDLLISGRAKAGSQKHREASSHLAHLQRQHHALGMTVDVLQAKAAATPQPVQTIQTAATGTSSTPAQDVDAALEDLRLAAEGIEAAERRHQQARSALAAIAVQWLLDHGVEDIDLGQASQVPEAERKKWAQDVLQLNARLARIRRALEPEKRSDGTVIPPNMLRVADEMQPIRAPYCRVHGIPSEEWPADILYAVENGAEALDRWRDARR